jgi:outer membrane immunogenic protein
MFRRTLLASAGAIALTGAALAADLPSRAPPPVYLPPPPVFTWTGFYIGLNAGYTWSNSNNFATNAANIQFCDAGCGGGLAAATAAAAGATTLLSIKDDGFIGGGQIGYNYQFANSWVVGLEADFQGTSARGHATAANAVGLAGIPTVSIGTSLSADKSLDFLGTVRGRIGFLITPTLLVYGTGGFAYGQGRADATFFQTINGPTAGIATAWSGVANISDTRTGWTAGGGLEWLFAPNWSVKAEYLYYDLGTLSANTLLVDPFLAGVVVPGSPAFFTNVARTSTRFNGNIVRAGLNYHFNWGYPAPVVAKY